MAFTSKAHQPITFYSRWNVCGSWLERYAWTGWFLLAFLAIAPVQWALERDAPFTVVRYIEPAPVVAGAHVTFEMPVTRQLERDCTARWSRHIIDAAGIRHEYEGVHLATAKTLRDIERLQGPWIRTTLAIPPGIAPGRAVLASEVEYECNPIHALWPIRMSLFFPFEVLPPSKPAAMAQ